MNVNNVCFGIRETKCKVDASWSPIERGDILVSSDTPGHAMKAMDPVKSIGAILGKALKGLDRGKG